MYTMDVLRRSVQNNDAPSVRILLRYYQHDINDSDSDGNTALILAACEHNIEIVRMLLKITHIDVNRRNNQGYTALMFASSKGGHIGIVRMLLNVQNTDMNLVDNEANTAIMFAAFLGDIEIVRAIASSSDLRMQNKYGKTALTYAIEGRHQDIICLLE